MLVTISKQPRTESFDASPSLSDKIIKKCPKVPIEANSIKNKICLKSKLLQTKGTINEIIIHPTDPVNINVTTGLSEKDNFLV